MLLCHQTNTYTLSLHDLSSWRLVNAYTRDVHVLNAVINQIYKHFHVFTEICHHNERVGWAILNIAHTSISNVPLSLGGRSSSDN
jgi:hypothetical protein